MNSKSRIVLVLALGLLWVTAANAQFTVLNGNVPAGFSAAGFIQAATLDNPADPNSGGTLTMNGTTMIVPANSIIQFPANTLTWAQLFSQMFSSPVYDPGITAPPNLIIAPGKTGLAIADNPARTPGTSPYLPFNAIVLGNIDVRNATGHGVGAYIVGLILPINQDLGNLGQGFISFIDYAHGRFEVGGTLGVQGTGTIIEINDPTGRYGWAHSPDPRWSVDNENPTITTGNGYPMCLPKTAAGDPDCPLTNRPLNPPAGFPNHDPFLQIGAPLQVYFMPASTAPGTTTPDPWKKIPLMLGDYIAYSGVLYKVNPFAPISPAIPWKQQTYISANTVSVDKLAVYTQPGTAATAGPAYLHLDRMVIGNGGAPVVVPPNLGIGLLGGTIPLPEPRQNITITGFVTDSTQLVDLVASDIDPNTGTETLRILGTTLPEPGVAGNPPRGNKGRFVFSVAPGAFLPTTRVYAAYSRHGQVQLPNQTGTIVPPPTPPVAVDPSAPAPILNAGSDGLYVGQYHAPMFTYQYPDAAPGFPSIPNNFQDQPFLVLGEGGNPSAGPLIPFPPFLP